MTDLSDKAFVLDQLERYTDGRDAVQIITASFRVRGCGVGAVHSRVAELRDEGYQILPAYIEGKTRRGWPRYVYRLVSEIGSSGAAQRRHEPSAPVDAEPPGASLVSPAAPLDVIPGQLRLIA